MTKKPQVSLDGPGMPDLSGKLLGAHIDDVGLILLWVGVMNLKWPILLLSSSQQKVRTNIPILQL